MINPEMKSVCDVPMPEKSGPNLTIRRRRPLDTLVYGFIFLCSAAVSAMILFFIGYILYKGIASLSLSFLTTAPNPITEAIGILPAIINTLYMVFLSLVISIPIGIGGAVYLQEYATNTKLVKTIEFTTETLSGIPSIIFGVFGYIFFCVALNFKVSLLSGALTLTIIVLPVILRTTGEALKAVPSTYREAALGLGAGKWYTIRTVILPSASGGILTSVLLATGRIVGESAALLLVAGGSAMYMPKGNFLNQIMGSGATLSVELYRYAYVRGDTDIGFAIAVVLLTLSVALNLGCRAINRKMNGENNE